SIGKTGILGFEATTNQAILALDVDRGRAEPRFVHYALLHAQDELIALGRGATQKNINKQIVENLTIPLPPLDEQQRIVDLVASVEAARDASDRQEQALRHLRFAALGFHIPSERLPDGWSPRPLSELVDVRNNLRIPVKSADRLAGPYPYCGANGV